MTYRSLEGRLIPYGYADAQWKRSDGPPEPTQGLQLPGGGPVITPDYLQRTDPSNLYPFLMVLPSGRFFIGKHSLGKFDCTTTHLCTSKLFNEAHVLDPVTFDTVTILPNMPGSVNNFLADHTILWRGLLLFFLKVHRTQIRLRS